ncbi:MAG: VanZ family protein [Pseudomonadota bacterium]
MFPNKKISYFLIANYMGIIALGSLTPLPFKTTMVSGWDKVVHFIMYIPLGFFLSSLSISPSFPINFFMVMCLGSLYGGMIELLQHFVSGRTASFYDEIANVLGVGSGFGLDIFKRMGQSKKK